MTNTDTIKKLIEALTEIKNTPRRTADCCESGNRRIKASIQAIIRSSDLDDATKQDIISAMDTSAPSSTYFSGTGVEQALDALKTILEAQEAALTESSTDKTSKGNAPLVQPTAFILRNLHNNLVADGSIFYVEFIKRSTGTLRKIKCRVGVKKHLKGGAKGYSAKVKGLLTVFDMQAKGYRSIPIEAIVRHTIGGQSFNFEGA